jgi:hypothetical protein
VRSSLHCGSRNRSLDYASPEAGGARPETGREQTPEREAPLTVDMSHQYLTLRSWQWGLEKYVLWVNPILRTTVLCYGTPKGMAHNSQPQLQRSTDLPVQSTPSDHTHKLLNPVCNYPASVCTAPDRGGVVILGATVAVGSCRATTEGVAHRRLGPETQVLRFAKVDVECEFPG